MKRKEIAKKLAVMVLGATMVLPMAPVTAAPVFAQTQNAKTAAGNEYSYEQTFTWTGAATANKAPASLKDVKDVVVPIANQGDKAIITENLNAVLKKADSTASAKWDADSSKIVITVGSTDATVKDADGKTSAGVKYTRDIVDSSIPTGTDGKSSDEAIANDQTTFDFSSLMKEDSAWTQTTAAVDTNATKANAEAAAIASDKKNGTIALGAGTVKVTDKAGDEIKDGNAAKSLTDAIDKAIKAVKVNEDESSSEVLDRLQKAVTSVPVGNATTNVVVNSTTLTGKKPSDGNVVVSDAAGNVYTFTYTTAKTGDMTEDEITALDSVFEDVNAITYSGNSVNTATVQTEFDKALTKAKADTKNTFFGKNKTGNGYTYTVKTATVKDGEVTGTLVRTDTDGTVYSYTYTAPATENTVSHKEAVKTAVDTIEANTYPMPLAAEDGKDEATLLRDKIVSDFNDALDGKAKAELGTGTVDKATRTANGSYNANVEGNNLNVALTYSSQSKIDDAIKLADKTTLKNAKTVTDSTLDTLKAGTSGTLEKNETLTKNLAVKDDAGTQTGSVALVKRFASTSDFSKALQPKTATKSVSKDDVKDAVLKLFTDAADEAKYTGDGVVYSAETVAFADKGKTADATADATIHEGGKYLVKVTASIANDFYDWNDDQKNAVSTATWYVEVETGKLTEVKNTGISLADQTFVRNDVYSDADNSKKDQTTLYSVIDLSAVLTPSDSNSDITYTVIEDKDGVVVKDTADKKALGTSFYKGSTKITKTAGMFKLAADKTGSFKVRAEANGKTATATITVRNNFKDVPATKYFSSAVAWAYKNGITSGKTDDLFGANDTVTRAQFITWLYKEAVAQDASVAIKDEDVKSVFSDVATSKFYAKAVQWAAANGITSGTTATTFSPNKKITRAEAITMLWSMKGKPYAGRGSQDEQTIKFTDVPADAYYAQAVKWAVDPATGTSKSQVTAGTTATTFGPKADCTRGQAITFVYNVFDGK